MKRNYRKIKKQKCRIAQEEWDSFVKETCSRIKEENPLENWDCAEYQTYTEIKRFMDSLKDKLVGRSLNSIWSMGINFDDDRDYYEQIDGKWYMRYTDGFEESEGPEWNDDRIENVMMRLDEPIILFIGDIQLEINYCTPSTALIGLNSLTRKEKSYQCNENIWRDISKYYSKNIVGRTLKDIIIERRFESPGICDPGLDENRDDLYREIRFVMDNNACFVIDTDLDYMVIYEKN